MSHALMSRHLPGKHDQLKHGGGRAGALLAALKQLIPDDQGDDALTFDDGRYLDWSSTGGGRAPGIRGWEIGDADGEVVQFDLDDLEMQQLASALSTTMLRDQAPPPAPEDRHSVLLSSLMLAGQRDHAPFNDNPEVDQSGRNFDWSERGEGGSYRLAVEADGEGVDFELTPDEMAQFHAQLVRSLLLADQAEARSAHVAEEATVRSATTKHRRSRTRQRANLDLCVRSFDFDTRSSSDGRTLEGYAAVFDAPSRIRDLQGDFDEVITRGAFERSLAMRTPVLQFDHGKDPRIGGVPIGQIRELREDDHGLYVKATLYDHPDVERVRQAIAGESIKGMSFRFQVPDKGDVWTKRSGDVDLREIRDADVHELGPVVFPAYDATSVSVRSLLAQLDPNEYRSLVRELAAELRAADLTEETTDDFTGRSTRGVDGGDPDPEPSESPVSTHDINIRMRLDDGALRVRGILR